MSQVAITQLRRDLNCAQADNRHLQERLESCRQEYARQVHGPATAVARPLSDFGEGVGVA